jgi:hypothetical protein
VKRIHNLDTVRGVLMLYIVGIIHGLFYLNLIPQWASSLMLFEMRRYLSFPDMRILFMRIQRAMEIEVR